MEDSKSESLISSISRDVLSDSDSQKNSDSIKSKNRKLERSTGQIRISFLSNELTNDNFLYQKNYSKLFSIVVFRLSITSIFLGYFLSYQPYSPPVSNCINHPNRYIQLAASIIIIGLILASFYYLLNSIRHKEYSDASSKEKHTLSNKISNYSNFTGIILIILMQSFLISYLFNTFAMTQYWIPLLLSISCLLFFTCSITTNDNCCPKVIKCLLFLDGAISGASLSFDALKILPNIAKSSFYNNAFRPITLLTCVFAFSILTIEPIIHSCRTKRTKRPSKNSDLFDMRKSFGNTNTSAYIDSNNLVDSVHANDIF